MCSGGGREGGFIKTEERSRGRIVMRARRIRSRSFRRIPYTYYSRAHARARAQTTALGVRVTRDGHVYDPEMKSAERHENVAARFARGFPSA